MAAATPTRTTLLERLREGADAAAWDDFFDRYGPVVYATAKRRGCSDHTAEEVVQDVMLALFEKKAVFRHDPARGRFRDWLGGVVRNKVALRRRAKRPTAADGQALVELAGADDGPEAEWDAAFDQALLAYLLDVVRREVSPRVYQAFELSTLAELSGAEVARLTGLSRNAVYLARQRVLRRLRELGAEHRDRGPPDEMIRSALRCHPRAAAERSIFARIERGPSRE